MQDPPARLALVADLVYAAECIFWRVTVVLEDC